MLVKREQSLEEPVSGFRAAHKDFLCRSAPAFFVKHTLALTKFLPTVHTRKSEASLSLPAVGR